MPRKITIILADDVYQGLSERVGRDDISRFIEGLVRPHVISDLRFESEYLEAAQDEQAEREALEWIEAHVDDGLN